MLYVEIRYTTVNLGNLQILFLMCYMAKKIMALLMYESFFCEIKVQTMRVIQACRL